MKKPKKQTKKQLARFSWEKGDVKITRNWDKPKEVKTKGAVVVRTS